MKILIGKLYSLLEDESAQGSTEYILLLVVVVAVALIFKDKMIGIIKGKLEEIATLIGAFRSDSL